MCCFNSMHLLAEQSSNTLAAHPIAQQRLRSVAVGSSSGCLDSVLPLAPLVPECERQAEAHGHKHDGLYKPSHSKMQGSAASGQTQQPVLRSAPVPLQAQIANTHTANGAPAPHLARLAPSWPTAAAGGDGNKWGPGEGREGHTVKGGERAAAAAAAATLAFWKFLTAPSRPGPSSSYTAGGKDPNK